MKKAFLFLASGALLITSCADDNATMQAPEGGGNVNFTVTMPSNGYGSRAFTDGYTATDLVYAVYDASNDAFISQGAATFAGDSHETTVSLQLVNGKGYKIAFFAHKETQGVYTFDAEKKEVAVNYAKMADYNVTDYDAFYAVKTIEKVTGPINESVTLTRPLAQVNWGTNDLDNPFVTAPDAYDKDTDNKAKNLVSKVEISGVYSAFDLLTGEVKGEAATVTFAEKARPVGETFPVANYEYMSMNYILVPSAQSSLVEAVLTPSNGTTASEAVKVANMPVQANYRTNIYGALLTVPGEFQIVKDPNWVGDNKVEFDAEGYRMTSSLAEAQELLKEGQASVAVDGSLVNAATGRAAGDGAVVFSLNKTVAKQSLKIIGKAASAVKFVYAEITGDDAEAQNREFKLVTTGDISAVEVDLPESAVNVEGRSETVGEKVNISNVTLTNAATAKVTGEVAIDELEKSENVDSDVEFDGAIEITVATSEDFLNAISDNAVEKINVNVNIDLTQATVEQLTVDSPKTIEIAQNATLTLGDTNYITGNADLNLIGKGTITNEYEGSAPQPNTPKELVVMNHGDLYIKNLTLVNDMNHHYHGNSLTIPHNSNAVSYKNDVNVTMDSVTIKSGEFTICGMGRGVASGVVTLSNSYFESNSSSQNGTGNWAYAMRIFGTKATLSKCEVKGIQGGVSAEETTMTIKSGKYYTVNSEGKTDAFYPVYVTNGGTVIIEDGEFAGAMNHSNLAEGTSCVVCGDNDVDLPSGKAIIKGGKFSGKPYNHSTGKQISLPEPLKWKAIENDAPYIWTVE